MALTGKQRRYLRGLGHKLVPVAQLGKAGITDAFVDSVDRALADHELIKIKLGEAAGLDRHEAADEIAQKTHAEVAQVLGYTLVLYRPDPEDPQIKLPKGKAAEADDDDDEDDDDAAD